jgi:hypothetical protein
VLLIYLWAFDMTTPVHVHKAATTTAAFAFGAPVTIEEEIEIRHACSGVLSHEIVDQFNAIHFLLLPSLPLQDRTVKKISISFTPPPALGPGKYRYRQIMDWQCNPLSSPRQVLVDVPFTISPSW